MRDSVPSTRYSNVCNVLRQWNISLIPTYRVYRLYNDSEIIVLTRWGSLRLAPIIPYGTRLEAYHVRSFSACMLCIQRVTVRVAPRGVKYRSVCRRRRMERAVQVAFYGAEVKSKVEKTVCTSM